MEKTGLINNEKLRHQLSTDNDGRDEFIVKLKRKVRDALNKTTDRNLILKIAALLKVI